MRLKTYDAATMAQAMAQVRRELGENAIIISAETERDGRNVRVVAALDEPDGESGFDDAMDEELAASAENGVSRALAYHGVPTPLAARLERAAAARGGSDAEHGLGDALHSWLRFRPLEHRDSRRAIMLVGPPGVGKTTVAAKLIVDAHRRGRKVTAVSCDAVRAGGIEQLEAFLRILQLPLATAETPEELSSITRAAAQGDIIIIDTPGTNPLSAPEIQNLDELIRSAGAEPLLVLAAGGDTMEARETAITFTRLGCRCLIVTRLDAVRRLGSILAAADAGRLALSGATAGPHAADAVSLLGPTTLARLLLSNTPDHVSHFEHREASR
jgi:flagellar biosynthesis protein FlhF